MRSSFSTESLRSGDVYKLLAACVVPRPIAWISTRSEEGKNNLAPYSFFNVVSSKPPIVAVASLGHKDTWRNVQVSREFVVNIGSEDLIEQINASSAGFSPDIDEFDVVGVTAESSDKVTAPRVQQAPIALECVLHDTLEVGNGSLIFGRVVNFSINDSVLDEDGLPIFSRVCPPSRLGRSEWGLAPRAVDQERPRLTTSTVPLD